MTQYLSIASLFETRKQRVNRLLNNEQFDKLLIMGIEPELLDMPEFEGSPFQ